LILVLFKTSCIFRNFSYQRLPAIRLDVRGSIPGMLETGCCFSVTRRNGGNSTERVSYYVSKTPKFRHSAVVLSALVGSKPKSLISHAFNLFWF